MNEIADRPWRNPERITDFRDGLHHRIAYRDGDVDAETMLALLDDLQSVEGELEAAHMVSDMAEAEVVELRASLERYARSKR